MPLIPLVYALLSKVFHILRYKDVGPTRNTLHAFTEGASDGLVSVDESSHFLEIASLLFLLHSIESVSHDGNQHVQEDEGHYEDC